MTSYRDDLDAARARIAQLEDELAASKRHDTDPDDLIPVTHDPAEVFANETLRDKLDDVNDRNPWIRWSALAAAILMIAGGLIQWCQHADP